MTKKDKKELDIVLQIIMPDDYYVASLIIFLQS